MGGRVIGPNCESACACILNARYLGNDEGGERLAIRVKNP